MKFKNFIFLIGNSIILYNFKKIKKTMKTIKLLLFLLLISYGASSQNYYGVNRDLIDNSTPKKATTQEIEKDRNEFVDNYLIKLKAVLNLDELQVIAIKNEILVVRLLVRFIIDAGFLFDFVLFPCLFCRNKQLNCLNNKTLLFWFKNN